MRLLILGATGGTGRELMSQATERGHSVTAFVRSPQKLGSLRNRVAVQVGDVRSVSEFEAVLPGHDAVLSALGPPGVGPTTILRAEARSTVAAIAYASHCTSFGRCETFSSTARLFDNLTPLAFSGG